VTDALAAAGIDVGEIGEVRAVDDSEVPTTDTSSSTATGRRSAARRAVPVLG